MKKARGMPRGGRRVVRPPRMLSFNAVQQRPWMVQVRGLYLVGPTLGQNASYVNRRSSSIHGDSKPFLGLKALVGRNGTPRLDPVDQAADRVVGKRFEVVPVEFVASSDDIDSVGYRQAGSTPDGDGIVALCCGRRPRVPESFRKVLVPAANTWFCAVPECVGDLAGTDNGAGSRRHADSRPHKYGVGDGGILGLQKGIQYQPDHSRTLDPESAVAMANAGCHVVDGCGVGCCFACRHDCCREL